MPTIVKHHTPKKGPSQATLGHCIRHATPSTLELSSGVLTCQGLGGALLVGVAEEALARLTGAAFSVEASAWGSDDGSWLAAWKVAEGVPLGSEKPVGEAEGGTLLLLIVSSSYDADCWL